MQSKLPSPNFFLAIIMFATVSDALRTAGNNEVARMLYVNKF